MSNELYKILRMEEMRMLQQFIAFIKCYTYTTKHTLPHAKK